MVAEKIGFQMPPGGIFGEDYEDNVIILILLKHFGGASVGF